MGISIGKSRRKKVGLALGGGAARGLAHIGVLEVLEREGVPIDIIAGTSMGALVGAFYARVKDVEQVKRLALDLGARRFTFFSDLTLPKTGLIRGRRIEGLLKSVLDDVNFGDLKIPFACVATDIDTGEEVVIREGLVWRAVRASGSIPVIFTVAQWEGKHLVDGGLVNPVPVSALREMGADFIIAVNVMPRREMKEATEPNIFNVIMQAIYITSYRMVKTSLRGADIVIEPRLKGIGYADFHHAEKSILQGELAAQDLIPEIERKYSVKR